MVHVLRLRQMPTQHSTPMLCADHLWTALAAYLAVQTP